MNRLYVLFLFILHSAYQDMDGKGSAHCPFTIRRYPFNNTYQFRHIYVCRVSTHGYVPLCVYAAIAENLPHQFHYLRGTRVTYVTVVCYHNRQAPNMLWKWGKATSRLGCRLRSFLSSQTKTYNMSLKAIHRVCMKGLLRLQGPEEKER